MDKPYVVGTFKDVLKHEEVTVTYQSGHLWASYVGPEKVSIPRLISPEDFFQMSAWDAKMLLNRLFPGFHTGPSGQKYLRMSNYGEGTGVFYRDLLNHEIRLGHYEDGIEIAVTTEGGFNIWPVIGKNGNVRRWSTQVEAFEWLMTHKDLIERAELLMKE